MSKNIRWTDDELNQVCRAYILRFPGQKPTQSRIDVAQDAALPEHRRRRFIMGSSLDVFRDRVTALSVADGPAPVALPVADKTPEPTLDRPRVTAILNCYGADGANRGQLAIYSDGTKKTFNDESLVTTALRALAA